MSQLHLSDEVLMAFADGELDEPVAITVAKAMAEDPGIAKRVAGFQQSRRLTRSVFSDAPMPDVPPELHAAISARIKAYEDAGRAEGEPDRNAHQGEGRRFGVSYVNIAMAASIAVVALGLGYFFGVNHRTRTDSLIAQVDSQDIRRELSRSISGQEVELPVGRMRVVATYRLANGSLCREFKLRAATDTAEAVACRNGEWGVTFALVRTGDEAEYTPSAGGDSVAAYLQDIGAGRPLVGEVEAKALSEIVP